MTAVNSSSVKITGALILGISGSALFNIMYQTHQIFYFTFSTDKLFVSKYICVAQGITFPTIGENVLPNTCHNNQYIQRANSEHIRLPTTPTSTFYSHITSTWKGGF